jgi:DNA invertase Pin-like site-specific DNA recombinase
MTGKATKAFVLLRVSSSGQTRRAGAEEGYSIEMQRDACQRKAKELGAEIAGEWVAPAESASRGFYKTLTEMIAALKARGDIAYVIVYKLERFARDELTDFAAYAEIKEAGAELVSATESIDGTPQGMLMHGILASINAYYSRDLAEKITDGRTTKAKLGGTPGRVPLGYLNRRRWDGANDIRYVEVDPERAPHIQWAFQAYATGEWPIKKLTEELYRRGLRTKPTPKRAPGKVSISTVHLFLRNPYYIGRVRFQNVEYQGDHPTLIPNELFERVQQELTAHRLSGERSSKHSHYLKGSVYCALCRRRLRFTKCTGRQGGKFDYFVCGNRHEGKKCPLPYLPAHRVEHFVTRYYEDQIRIDGDRVAELEPLLVEQFERLVAYRQREVVRCQKEVDDILGQRQRLVENHLANPKAIPLDVLEVKQAELGKKLKAAKTKLTRAGGNIKNANKGLRAARQLLQQSAGAYSRVDPQTRRRWNQAFFRKLFVGPEGIKAAELTDEFGALLREDLAKRLEAMVAQPRLRFGRGSSERVLVELAGLEPATSWLRSTDSD